LTIAFAGHREGKVSLYVMRRQTGEVTELTGASSSDDSFPQWSPRGDALVFLRVRNGAREIAVFSLDSRQVETVHSGASPARSP
jgi:Tol biopolymer transport system component